jgi:mannose-1-phosphate guanylyltransferase
VLRNLKFEKPDYTYADSVEYIRDRYPTYPNLSLDYAILEQCKNVFVMKCDFGWADIGTWHAIYECQQKTEDDNVVLDSEVILENSRNNVIRLQKGHVGVINGLDGFIVAEQGDVLLICPKEDSSALIRKYVNEVGIKYGEKYI